MSAAWMAQALCAEVDGDLWFPEKGHAETSRAAKRICAKCPVQVPCAALGKDQDHGIWGGISRNRHHRGERAA